MAELPSAAVAYRALDNGRGGIRLQSEGLSGSITAESIDRLLGDMTGKVFVDLGCGDGRVVLAALLKGAVMSHGYELPANIYCKVYFDRAVTELTQGGLITENTAVFHLQDIITIPTLPVGTHTVFSFCEGINPEGITEILRLLNLCLTVQCAILFGSNTIRKPDEALYRLNYRKRPEEPHYTYTTMTVAEMGGGSKTAWIFTRDTSRPGNVHTPQSWAGVYPRPVLRRTWDAGCSPAKQ